MLEHLLEYGEQVGLEPEPGFKVKRTSNGPLSAPRAVRYLGFSQLGDTSLGRKNPGLEFTKAPDLTQATR